MALALRRVPKIFSRYIRERNVGLMGIIFKNKTPGKTTPFFHLIHSLFSCLLLFFSLHFYVIVNMNNKWIMENPSSLECPGTRPFSFFVTLINFLIVLGQTFAAFIKVTIF